MMNFVVGQVTGAFSVNWTVAVYAVIAASLVLIGCVISAVLSSDGGNPKQFGLSIIGLLVGLAVTIVSLSTTHWINDNEVGLTEKQVLRTGVYPYFTQGEINIPRNGSLSLVNAANIGQISVGWVVVEPEKLVESYQEIRSFYEGGMDESTFRNWMSLKLITTIPKSRELLLPVEESSKLNEEFAQEVQSILGRYGLKTRISVTKSFTIDLGDTTVE